MMSYCCCWEIQRLVLAGAVDVDIGVELSFKLRSKLWWVNDRYGVSRSNECVGWEVLVMCMLVDSSKVGSSQSRER